MKLYKDFVHLHVHTDYSLKDSTIRINSRNTRVPNLIKEVKAYGMTATAITDHSSMGGIIEFYKSMNSNALKPIIGCELTFKTFKRTGIKSKEKNTYHLTLLAQDYQGYQNLCSLCTEGNIVNNAINKEFLSSHSKGIIALSGCIKGELSSLILNNCFAEAEKVLAEYLDIFGMNNFYIELMDHGFKEQKIANKGLFSLAEKYEIPFVATNNVHYLNKKHSFAREVLKISDSKEKNPIKNIDNINNQMYFKSYEEMLDLFKEIPESLSTTMEVAERCNIIIPLIPEVNHQPKINLKNYKTSKEILKEICLNNLNNRYGCNFPRNFMTGIQLQEIKKRLNYELNILDKYDHIDYLLIWHDIVDFAKKNNIAVGTGRGTVGCSLIAYLSGITDVNPIQYNLPFERFFNQKLPCSPNIVLDFAEVAREKILKYIIDKYSHSNTSFIGTYGRINSKLALRITAEALDYKQDKYLPILQDIETNSRYYFLHENSDTANEFMNESVKNKLLIETAKCLEGLINIQSVHAAGILIGNETINKTIPLTKMNGYFIETYFQSEECIVREKKGKEYNATQYTATECEELCFLTLDLLGLKTLDVLQKTIELIKEHYKIEIDLNNIPVSDEKTYSVFNNGNLGGVFQFESSGLQKQCKKFNITSFKDIIALIALYSPGSMEYIDEFIKRKKDPRKVKYLHPKLEPILNETYGIFLYQEQVLKIGHIIAGYSLEEADILRRDIGRRKAEKFCEQKNIFIKSCKKHSNINDDIANELWDEIDKFTGYTFNKSHAVAYGLIAYRCAYLKANYPEEFSEAIKLYN